MRSSNDGVQPSDGEEVSELDYASRAKAYVPVEPAYSFDRVILPDPSVLSAMTVAMKAFLVLLILEKFLCSALSPQENLF